MVIADSSNNRLIVVDLMSNEMVETIGSGKRGCDDAKNFKDCTFYQPQGMCTFVSDSGEHCLMVCDTKNHCLRVVNLTTKEVKRIAGEPEKRGSDRYGGRSKLIDQELASPWDVTPMDNNKFIVAMAGTH